MPEHAYKWNASDYLEQSSAQHIWAEQLLSKINLSGKEHILDLGCGDGKISAEIASRLSSGIVMGIDASKDMVSLAEQTYSEKQNLFFQHDDATEFSYHEKFDVVFSNAVLHWVQDHRAVLQNCYKSLRTGGRVLLQMGGKGNASEFVDVVTEVTNKPEWQSYFSHFDFPFHFYNVDDYQAWLEHAGFQAERIELIPKDMQHEGKKGLAGWFRTTWMPYTNQLPEKQREHFINDIVDTYLVHNPVDEFGKTHVSMVRLEVEAFKAE